jgi:hypothetical protein
VEESTERSRSFMTSTRMASSTAGCCACERRTLWRAAREIRHTVVTVQRILACASPHRLQSTSMAVDNDLKTVVLDFGHGNDVLLQLLTRGLVQEGAREGSRGRHDDRDDDMVVNEKDGRSEAMVVRETLLLFGMKTS